LLNGVELEEMIKVIPLKRIKEKAGQIREAVRGSLETAQIILIRSCLDQMRSIQLRIDELGEEIKARIARRKEDLRIAMSIPGIGFVSAVTILAEIRDFKDFAKAEQLAAWSVLVPAVYQSADKHVTGTITKHGSRHIRRILVEVAHAIARTNKSRLKKFFRRIQAKKGHNVAAVSLARKVPRIPHHLLMNRELYQEDDPRLKKEKTTNIDISTKTQATRMNLAEMIQILIKAGYMTRKTSLRKNKFDTGG
jgi:transposase